MSDFHILEQAPDQKTVSVACHFPVAATNNEAGISYRDALVAYLTRGGATISSDVADAGELTQMQAGEVYEHQTSVRFSSLNLTNAQRLAEVQAFYNTEKTKVQADLQTRLAFYGYGGDVT